MVPRGLSGAFNWSPIMPRAAITRCTKRKFISYDDCGDSFPICQIYLCSVISIQIWLNLAEHFAMCQTRGVSLTIKQNSKKLPTEPGISRYNGGLIKGYLKPLNNLVLWWTEGLLGPHGADTRQPLGQLCVWWPLIFQSAHSWARHGIYMYVYI